MFGNLSTTWKRLLSEAANCDLFLSILPPSEAEALARRMAASMPNSIDIGDLMQSVEFKVFAGPAQDPKGRVAALRLPGGVDLSRKEIDDLAIAIRGENDRERRIEKYRALARFMHENYLAGTIAGVPSLYAYDPRAVSGWQSQPGDSYMGGYFRAMPAK